MHSFVRSLCCDYMVKNSDYFSQFITEEFKDYVQRKRIDGIQGNHIELQALSELFARPIEVYHYCLEPINIFYYHHDEEEEERHEDNVGGNDGNESIRNHDKTFEAIRISYHTIPVLTTSESGSLSLSRTRSSSSGHYNSVRDLRSFNGSTGIYEPKVKPPPFIDLTGPRAHEVETAIRSSENDELEKQMLEDKLRATDWEATNEALEEQIARESYLEWIKEEDRRRNHQHHHHTATSNSSSATSSTVTSTGYNNKSNNNSPSRNSPNRCSLLLGSSSSSPILKRVNKSSSSSSSSARDQHLNQSMKHDFNELNLYQSYYDQFNHHHHDNDHYRGHNRGQSSSATTKDSAERDILAQVLMQSRQEYLDSLRTNNNNNSNSSLNQPSTSASSSSNQIRHSESSSSSSYSMRTRSSSPRIRGSSTLGLHQLQAPSSSTRHHKQKSPSPPASSSSSSSSSNRSSINNNNNRRSSSPPQNHTKKYHS